LPESLVADCILPDGNRLHYHASGAGEPLLLLHGWGLSRAVFAEVEQRLARSCLCLSVDLPGHGGSPAPEEFSLEQLAAAVVACIDQLQLKQPILLGWSLGGLVAQAAALQLQDRLAGLILVSTTPRFVADRDWSHGLPALQLRALRRDLQRNFARSLGEFFQLMFVEDQVERQRFREIVRFAAGAGRLPDESSTLAGLELLQKADLRAQLPSLDQPTLVMHGEADRIIPVAAGRYLAAQIDGAEQALYPGVGHAPFLVSPEHFCRRVESFIHGLPRT
jgi:pimeloyl-[acyl-carrier protein] methyl ester esterase